jgi:pimeloyl-ACP methyl ester carboxylesterase
MSLSGILFGALASLVALVAISYIVEALRPVPKRPEQLDWAPDIQIQYLDLGDATVRYIKTGAGPKLLLLHTLRTQLDLYEKIVPDLARRFTVYAFDFPGHGWSDIPKAAYAPEDFYRWTAAFLDRLDLKQTTVVGTSIGGVIALLLAARGTPRIDRVISVNPYDYPPAGGVRKSSVAARLVLTFADVPVLGATITRLRNRFVSDLIFRGGVASPDALSDQLAREFYEVGARPGHYQGFLSLLAHERQWPRARNEYPNIKVPVLLVYGDQDWAPDPERARTRSLIAGVVAETVANSSHFLSLDRPQDLHRLIVGFADPLSATS